ncbi:MAG: glycosyltransferase, partial [Terracidiphilus sp.]
PLPSVYLALCWKASGFYPEVTREAVLLVATLALLGVWRLAMRLVGVASVAFWTVLLTGLYPIWFAQSTLAHADIFAAACTLWGLNYILPERGRNAWAAALWFAAAALSKETSIAIPLTLAVVNVALAFRSTAPIRARLLREAAWLSTCVLPLAAWYGYHYSKTGFIFGNPEFVRYNAQATLTPLRIAVAFGHRILQLTAHMNLFVPVLMAFAALLLNPRTNADSHERASIAPLVLLRIFFLLLVEALLFSVLGGALLTRYLLPMYPLVLLVAVSTLYRRVPYWYGLTVFSGVAFIVALFVNPPYGFAPEDNLAYSHVIRMHQAAIWQLKKQNPGATVLTAWPMTDELTKPELGYVKEPWDVCAIDNFSTAEIARAAAEPEKYSVALPFSTKYEPPPLFPRLSGEILAERYFGLHHDLPPDMIAQRLDGTVEWKWERSGGTMWVALIRFNRQIEARLQEPALGH